MQFMKKQIYFFALSCVSMLYFVAACGSESDSQPEPRESIIEEVANLPDAEIKIPAMLIGNELADIPVINADSAQPEDDSDNLPSDAALPDNPVSGIQDEDNNVTYHLDGETRTQILHDLAEEIQTSIQTILADKYYYPNISDIKINSDCTEFTIYLTADQPNLYESSLIMSFYTVGDRYQIYNGVPMDDAKTTVVYIHAETGAELARTDSTSVQQPTD